jgi:hypothetical protein
MPTLFGENGNAIDTYNKNFAHSFKTRAKFADNQKHAVKTRKKLLSVLSKWVNISPHL